MSRFKVRVREFQRGYARIGPVVLTVLRLSREEEFEEEGDPYDSLAYILESRSKSNDYVEIEIEFLTRSKNHESMPDRVVRGEYNPTLRGGGRSLFPRPARLRRVGVVRLERVLKSMEKHGGYALLGDGDIEWYRASREVYVFEGEAEVPDDIAYVVLETASGVRWIRTLKTFVLRQSSQQHGQQER